MSAGQPSKLSPALLKFLLYAQIQENTLASVSITDKSCEHCKKNIKMRVLFKTTASHSMSTVALIALVSSFFTVTTH